MSFQKAIFWLTFILIMLSSSGNTYADPGLSIPVTPWMNAEFEPDITPKHLSLDDLEDLDDFAQMDAKRENVIKEKPSRLETLYSDRVLEDLHQFGYDMFGTTENNNDAPVMPAGIIQDDYILSAGDEIDIIIRGQTNIRQTYKINNQGLLIIDDFSPVSAAGRTLKDVRADLQSEASQMHNTSVFAALSGIRQIGTLVIGHVHKPGRKTLTAFHTVLDALAQSGGIEKTGSLRSIKLVRAGTTKTIDLYQLLTSTGNAKDILLKDGDRIIVPPIGHTVAISGDIKRPGIYEIRKGEKLTLNAMLYLGGDVLTPGQNRFVKHEFRKNGEETIQDIETRTQKLFGNGSILMVAQAQEMRKNAVTLSGHTRKPGTHDLRKVPTLTELIESKGVLGQDIYPLIGIIERKNPDQLTTEFIAFSPRKILLKENNERLLQNDIVHLFSMQQIRNLDHDHEDLLHNIALTSDENFIKPALKKLLQERSAFIRGSVREPGAYPITENTTLKSLLAIADGTTLEANTENIEITQRFFNDNNQPDIQRLTVNLTTGSPTKIFLNPGDTIRVNQKFHAITNKTVSIRGEVNHPGNYDLMPGDTLSSLIDRAGGLTDQGYSIGTVFSRKGERQREEKRYKAQARDLEMKLAANLQNVDDDKKPDMAQVEAVQNLILQLKDAKAVGRITVQANPGVLDRDPAQDILLEAGDKIYIPKRPLTVRVVGEVLSPAALQFREGKSPRDYIEEAGGYTYHADKSRSFVIYPDGSAQPLRGSRWRHKPRFIPPGSTIIVPRDPKPFDFLETTERISQVLANLAISGLYIDAIGDDD